MPKFSKISKDRLVTCHPDLQQLFNEVIKYYDCVVVYGIRDKEAQDLAYSQGKSKLKWPKSKHNSNPSKAIDVAPFINGVSWNARQCSHFAGFVMGIAQMLGIKIICGADWDSDNDINDQTFNDLVHFELK